MGQTTSISLKASVDKKNNRIIFVESDKDFIDVLFSFLTMPMGTIIRLTRKKPPTVGLGCMNNLYESIENLDVQQFRNAACKTMLLNPRNAAAVQCKKLKLKIDDGQPLKYFLCSSTTCSISGCRLLSHYSYAICGCGEYMNREMDLSETNPKVPFDPVSNQNNGGVFVKEQTRFIVSDGLQVMPSSTEASLYLLSKLVGRDWSTIEERNLNIGVDEVLTLLKCSLVSKTPLSDTLLKHSPVCDLGKEDFHQGSYIKSRMDESTSNVNGNVHIKLIFSKSKKMVCYAEASENFVDLLFSFLTVPLGYILKEMHSSISKGCINRLYNSVYELDAEQYLKSNENKAMLVNPKLAPNFSYKNNPLSIKEDKHPPYYYAQKELNKMLTSDRDRVSSWACIDIGKHIISASTSDRAASALTVMDPKSHFKETTGGGFVKGPAMFTVTDNLIITPISPISSLSLLKKLNVPVGDIKELVVHVGCEEALRLMVASFVSESVLTDALLRKPDPEN